MGEEEKNASRIVFRKDPRQMNMRPLAALFFAGSLLFAMGAITQPAPPHGGFPWAFVQGLVSVVFLYLALVTPEE